VSVELITPIKAATFSEKDSATITPTEQSGFARVPFVFSPD
jgi:hypothetical protein